MKKTSKLFGAVALSAALAMGCAVPALASTADGTDMTGTSSPAAPGDDHEADGMHTDVKVKTKIGQISVSVPLNVTIVAPAEGGAITAPAAGTKDISGGTATIKGYRIENTSSFPVEVSKVSTKAAGTDWAITGTTYNKGLLTMTLTPSAVTNAIGGSAQSATGVNEGDRTGTNKAINIDGSTDQAAGWKIAGGGSAANPRIMGLTLAGNGSPLKNVGAEDGTSGFTAAEDAFTVSYTVAATTLTDAEQIK